MPPPTTTDQKLTFLNTQIRILTQPPTLPSSFTTTTTTNNTSTSQLGPHHISTALTALTHRLREHAAHTYPGIATRHVAEQLDVLYWRQGERDVFTGRRGGGRGGVGNVQALERGCDLANLETIGTLPTIWNEDESEDDFENSTQDPGHNTVTSRSTQRQRVEQYKTLAATLQASSARRTALREKLARYRAYHAALEPYRIPAQTIQPNLCVRDGELEGELERMRMLIGRVVGRMGGLEAATTTVTGSEDDDDVEDGLLVDEGARIRGMLDML